uniref:Cathepsin K-like isoform X2 n=1 Tax=Pogona vitticeps TaxID=103695 RepID=A0ABM5EM79_9SAUR
MGSCCFLQAKMMPFLGPSMLVALLRVSAALDPARDMAWEDWKSLHGKAYLEGEEASRRVVWEENLRMIEQHNWEASQGKHTYWLGMNHFGDLTNEEFNQMNSFLLDEVELAVGNVSFFHKSATERVPRNVDWREKGYVTRVKNQDGICCRNVKKIGIKISGFRRVPQGNEKALEHAVAKFGPVSVGINFNGKKFQFYKSGIFSADCGHGKLRHAVLVVGYEEKKVRKSYWIVKNSWSEKWGVKGYLYLEKGSNLCGIANEAYYPV